MPVVIVTGYLEWQNRYKGIKTKIFGIKIGASIVVLATLTALVIWRIADPGVAASANRWIYILVGLMGVPIFALGGGPGYVLHPSFGYLLGFIPGAYVIGRLVEKREPLTRPFLLAALLAGTMVIYLLGVPVLYLNLNFIKDI